MNEEMTRRMHFGGGDFDDDNGQYDDDGNGGFRRKGKKSTAEGGDDDEGDNDENTNTERRKTKRKSWTNSLRRVKCIKPRKRNSETMTKNSWINLTKILKSSVEAVYYKAREKQSAI